MGLGLGARLRVRFGLRVGARPASLRTKQGSTTLGETAALAMGSGARARRHCSNWSHVLATRRRRVRAPLCSPRGA